MQKVLFIDRDGTLIIEPPVDYQVDSLEKLEFYPKVFQYLSRIVQELDYKLVMVTNQDGLGTASFPENTFWPAHNKMLTAFENEGIEFDDICIDRSFPEDNLETRKPGIGLLRKYIKGDYDLEQSFVLGDRWSDVELAKNLGAKGIYLNQELTEEQKDASYLALNTTDWKAIYQFLKLQDRKVVRQRNTKETKIQVELNLDGQGLSDINTGISFFDHMLDQIARHAQVDLKLQVDGDLQVDEHHTIEDTAIVLGEAFREALGKKVGIGRYGFSLPMDECLAQVALDFGGRSYLIWEADFQREYVGKMPTELFDHFFKSFADAALCNLNIKVEGMNEHHKIESIFKAFARAIRMAIRQDKNSAVLPSTKGSL
ncbi:MAG: bifunctional histidinol-phosphatase/imidazoleglycerol-phosphate dehydratase HisB [Saprospiraceae bacterium]|nr:bifunctional histidinol-phosphatase/imidazoleglycerol-phosphate dehydratase HisB [Saprospiraceae bacterium]